MVKYRNAVTVFHEDASPDEMPEATEAKGVIRLISIFHLNIEEACNYLILIKADIKD
jgi:hypothetical protein